MRTIVLCPMELERRAVARRVRGLADTLRTGWGPDAIEKAVRDVAERSDRPALVILAGVAGGLRDGATARVADAVVDEAGDRWTPMFGSDQIGADGATILGVDWPVSDPQRKRSLAQRWSADLVDCESHAFARACVRCGLDWTVVRGVSDGPDDVFPEQVARWIRPDGRLRLSRAAIDVMHHPRLAVDAFRLGKRSKRALREVGELVAAMLDAQEQSGGTAVSAVIPSEDSNDGRAAPPTDSKSRVDHNPDVTGLSTSRFDAAPAWRIEPPLPQGVDTVLIFGGAFDPPHRPHRKLPPMARDRIGADWLLYVPAARAPLKAHGPEAPEADRLDMLRLLIDGLERASVSDIEIVRGGESYTAQTLRALREALPGPPTLRLLIGADQAAQFHHWREPGEVIRLAEPVVMLRRSDDSAEALLSRLTPHWADEQLERWRRWIVDLPRIDASSTEIRRIIRAQGHDAQALGQMVPQAVRDHIKRRRLYSHDESAGTATMRA